MYRSNITQELGGVPTKQQIRELLKTALFFYQVANEELLSESLIKEGTRCIEEGKLNDAQNLFEEANLLEKWRDIYGPSIFANLAYICAMRRNYTKAKQHLEDYLALYGNSEFNIDPDEHQKLSYAQQQVENMEAQQLMMSNSSHQSQPTLCLDDAKEALKEYKYEEAITICLKVRVL